MYFEIWVLAILVSIIALISISMDSFMHLLIYEVIYLIKYPYLDIFIFLMINL